MLTNKHAKTNYNTFSPDIPRTHLVRWVFLQYSIEELYAARLHSPEGVLLDHWDLGIVALYEPTQCLIRLRNHLLQHLHPQWAFT